MQRSLPDRKYLIEEKLAFSTCSFEVEYQKTVRLEALPLSSQGWVENYLVKFPFRSSTNLSLSKPVVPSLLVTNRIPDSIRSD
jgi:hypothetical protein